MLESKQWHNKTEIKNVMIAKMGKLTETCDQYSHKKTVIQKVLRGSMGNFLRLEGC